MKLSVITINYNNREGLRRTIDSVVGQTFRDFEWIIIDGGSTDGSRELIEQIHDPRLAFWCSEPDKGIYNAMNKGVAKAKGEYLNFMNSGDCFYEKDTLLVAFSKINDADILYGDCEQIYNKYTRIVSFSSNLNLYDLYRCNICQQAMFVKKYMLLQEGFDESYYVLADWARWIDAALNGATFRSLHQIICRYDMNGMSSKNTELSSLDYQKIMTLYPEMVKATLHRLHDYEENIIVQRTLSIINKGRLPRIIMRLFLKVMIIVFYCNKIPYGNHVRWFEE